MASYKKYRIEYTMRYLRDDGTYDVETRVNNNCTTRKSFDQAMAYYANNPNCVSFKELK